jgi:surface protein
LPASSYYDNQESARNGVDIGPFDDPAERSWDSGMDHVANSVCKVVFDDSFAQYSGLTSTAYWFYNSKHLQGIEGIENLNTNNATDMRSMFDGCATLASLDVSSFTTSRVATMRWMFAHCAALKSLDISHFATPELCKIGRRKGYEILSVER